MQHKNQGKSKPFFDSRKVIESDDCILWEYGKSWNGYGQLTVSGKTKRVHRLVMEFRGIQKPIGKNIVGHTCNNRSCFNYRHLKWIDAKENMMDKISDGTRQIGEKNANSKLSRDKVIFIRDSKLPQRELAKMFGVSQATVNDARLGKTWSWI